MYRSNDNLLRLKPLVLWALLPLFLLPSLQAQTTKMDNNPGARWGHVLLFDETNENLLLYGGTTERGGEFFNDTWLWKNGKWTKMEVEGPPSRGFCAAAYHRGRKTIILHGGRGKDGISYSDLWEWNGTTWRQIEKNSAYQADHHQMVYMDKENALFAFGGWNGKEVVSESWLWSEQWEKLGLSSPPKRAAFSMVYNKDAQSVILFGGLWINGQYADIWEYSNKEWKPLTGPYDNSSLDHHAMVYEDVSKQILGFGGKNYRYVNQNTTFYISQNEIKAIDVKGPRARHSFGFTYDAKGNKAYLYGGKESVNGEQLPLSDFWIWDGQKWSQI